MRFWAFTLFLRLSSACLSFMQTIRPTFSFSFCRKSRIRVSAFALLLRTCLYCKLFCPFLLFTKRRKPQRGKEGKGWRNLKVFCAFPDAQPLTLAVVGAWQSLWLFDVMRQDDSEGQGHGLRQPWGIKGGPRTALFVVLIRGFQGEEIEIFPLNGFLVSFWPRKKKHASADAESPLAPFSK